MWLDSVRDGRKGRRWFLRNRGRETQVNRISPEWASTDRSVELEGQKARGVPVMAPR
jgi:hypothetical protein